MSHIELITSIRAELGLQKCVPAFVWLVEHEGEGALDRLRAEMVAGTRWTIAQSEGPSFDLLRPADGERLTLVLGRQASSSQFIGW